MWKKRRIQTIAELQPGDHVCVLYQTQEEHRAVITPFVRLGLEQNEKVIYIMDMSTAKRGLEYLRDDGLDVEPYLASEQIVLLTQLEAYMREDVFDPDAMIALLQEETQQALQQGYLALRVTGEMTWALRGLPGSERLIEYESKLNEFFPGSQCLAICQYDMRRFAPGLLLDILRTHPIAIIGDTIYDNFYYIPPEEMLANNREAVELQRWIEHLKSRQQMKDALVKHSQRLENAVNKRNKELRAAHEKLQRQERLALMGQLAGGVGHELRNPLGVISNAIYFLKEIASTQENVVKEYLDLIASEVDKAQKIVSDLLHLSRVKSINRTAVDIPSAVRQVLDHYPPPEGVKVHTAFPKGLPPIYVEPQHLDQILINLILNAYQAIPEGGRLDITAQVDWSGKAAGKNKKPTVAITIADSGTGIPPENLEKIFEPLFTTKAKGIGLGLAVTKNLVEANEGWIEVQSDPGVGSRFTVIFPTREDSP